MISQRWAGDEGPKLSKIDNIIYVYFINYSDLFFSSFSRSAITFDDNSIDNNFTAVEVINRAKKGFFRSHKNNKRIFFAAVEIRAIDLNLNRVHKVSEEYIRCLNLYFSATCDPVLTVFEVKTLLFTCFSQTNKLNFVYVYLQEFRKIMPNCPAVIVPRKLSDIVRCQLRQNLNNCNLPLSAAVEKLQLPKILMSFILVDVTVFSIESKQFCLQRQSYH